MTIFLKPTCAGDVKQRIYFEKPKVCLTNALHVIRTFFSGTFCVNETFSRQLSDWLKSNWSYSTAFYPGESKFSKIMEFRVKEATQLLPENGGKFQITSYPQGIGKIPVISVLISFYD